MTAGEPYVSPAQTNPSTRRSHRWIVIGIAVAIALTGGLVYILAQPTLSPLPPLPYDMERGPFIQATRGMTALEAFDAVTMAVVDLNGDGVKEIIAHNDNNRLYVFSGHDGSLIAELETPHPEPWEARTLAGPAIGDLTGNGLIDIVVTNSAGWVTAFEAQPAADGGIDFDTLWTVRLDPHDQDPDYKNNMYYGVWEGHPGLDGPAFLGDTNGDGRDEVFVQLDDMPGMYKLNPDGSVAWWANYTDGNAGPKVADLTNDGRLEVIFPSDGGKIHIMDATTMNYRCFFDAAAIHDVWPGSISVAPTLGDLTGDGRLEIAFGVRNITRDRDDPDWIFRSHAAHFAIDADCKVLWQRSWEWNNPHVHMTPAAVDVNGNGAKDLIFQDWNTVGHLPGNWEPTGTANLYVIEGATGNLLWQRETETYWSNKNVAVADVIGDGVPVIIVNEDKEGHDGLSLFRITGSRVGFLAAPSGWAVSRGPVVTDLTGNGKLDIILPVHRDASGCPRDLDVGCREGALQVYHTNSTAEVLWGNNHLMNNAYRV